MVRASAAPGGTGLESVEGGQRDRVAKLVFSRPADDSGVLEEGVDEPHFHALQAKLLVFSLVL
jgi:hypothetical protein